jgi:hypothetical protein
MAASSLHKIDRRCSRNRGAWPIPDAARDIQGTVDEPREELLGQGIA